MADIEHLTLVHHVTLNHHHLDHVSTKQILQ